MVKDYKPVRYLGEVIKFEKLEYSPDEEIGVSVNNVFLGSYRTKAEALKYAKKIVKQLVTRHKKRGKRNE